MLLPCAGLGGFLWLVWWWHAAPGLTTALLMSGPLLAVPLGLFAEQGPRSRWRDAAAWLLLPSATTLLVAVSLPPGWTASLLALPWLVVTALLAAHGLARLLPRQRHPAAELCVDAAYVFILVGGVWAMLDRMGARPLGYDPLLVQLTAIHFHFAGFALPLMAGLLGRHRADGLPRLVALGVVGGIPLVAVGLVLSQTTGQTTGEWAASWTLALAAGAVAALQLWEVRSMRPGINRLLLGLSGASLLLGMLLAAAYGYGRAQGLLRPTIADMIALHGVGNALGFALPGLLAWALSPPLAPERRPRPPGRGLWARGFIGNGWFLSEGLADPSLPPPTGQLDRLDRLDNPDFSAAAVHPEVRAFYEETARYELWVRPRWPLLLGLPARLYVALARQMGQLVLPLDRAGAWQQVRVRTFAPDASLTALSGARLYERRYANNTPMFIAAYAITRQREQPYLSVVLPLPGSCLISVMKTESLGDGGLRLRSSVRGDEEAGLFLDTPITPIRLPLSEDLLLGPLEHGFAPGPSASIPDATIGAVHRFRLLGLVCLELEYLIRPLTDRSPSA
jgi:hypothetical protein